MPVEQLYRKNDAPGATPIRFAHTDTTPEARHAALLNANGFNGSKGQIIVVPSSASPDGQPEAVYIGAGASGECDPFAIDDAALKLPPGDYHLAEEIDKDKAHAVAFAWGLGAYQFSRYRARKDECARLQLPKGVDPDSVLREVSASWLVRDLVNTPANDMGPDELEAAARKLADAHGGVVSTIDGEALAAANFPLIYAVGKASPRAPRLIDLRWGDDAAPKITLVGKGVCFDTGGLNIKGANGMGLMKKDMGGAAHVLGLAQMIMSAKLPCRLRVLIPAVENSISGTAMRPGDVYQSRAGLTVEIGNTDAEGRLVLADAIAEACSEAPEHLIVMATLTGAGRQAVGPEIAPFYTDDDGLAERLAGFSRALGDPVWRMPLWSGYDAWLESGVADLSNIASTPMAGSVTAALFLKRFVKDAACWAHFDIYAWNLKPRPARPVGGEAQAIRTLYAHFENLLKVCRDPKRFD